MTFTSFIDALDGRTVVEKVRLSPYLTLCFERVTETLVTGILSVMTIFW